MISQEKKKELLALIGYKLEVVSSAKGKDDVLKVNLSSPDIRLDSTEIINHWLRNNIALVLKAREATDIEFVSFVVSYDAITFDYMEEIYDQARDAVAISNILKGGLLHCGIGGGELDNIDLDESNFGEGFVFVKGESGNIISME